MEELREERAQRDLQDTYGMTATAKVEKGDDSEDLSWFSLAIDFPLYKATYTRVAGTDLYVVDLKQQTPRKQGNRNLVFEVVYPLYKGLNEIIETRKTPSTTLIKVQVSSREHVGVTFACDFSPDKWSYTTIDKITEELADQLTMKQNLNIGLLMKLSLYQT